MTDEIIPDVALVDNTSQRLPCVLVLDGSSSMADSGAETDAIRELNAGLKVLEAELQGDDIASQRVQVLVIRLGDDDRVETVLDWTDAMDFSAPTIEANGRTPLGAAMRFALQKVEDRKVGIVAGVAIAGGIALLAAYLIGRRIGRVRSTVVEIRRI